MASEEILKEHFDDLDVFKKLIAMANQGGFAGTYEFSSDRLFDHDFLRALVRIKYGTEYHLCTQTVPFGARENLQVRHMYEWWAANLSVLHPAHRWRALWSYMQEPLQ